MSVWEWLEWERKCSETVVALSTGAAFYFYELTHFLDWINEDHFTFRLQYKHSTFANRKYEEQAYPQKSEYVRPHSSNSIENAAVPPFPGARLVTILKCRSSDISQPYLAEQVIFFSLF